MFAGGGRETQIVELAPRRQEPSTLPPSPDTLDEEARRSRIREDRRLLLRYHEHGDAAAREELVERFLPLARQLARRYQRTNEPLDDLMQVASVGLVKAIDRFDPSRGTAFSTYAVPTILGELKRYFRDSGWAVHVPRGMQERVMKLDTAAQELHLRFGEDLTQSEIAERIGVSQMHVSRLIRRSLAQLRAATPDID